jgi:hypothetical protein
MSNETTFKLKRGVSGGAFPDSLTHGELAVNTVDGRLFVGSVTGSVYGLNNKFFPEGITPSANIQGDRWFNQGIEYAWVVDGLTGGYWIELGNAASSIPRQSAFLTVKDFGAKGDGRTDDTLSIQNALNTVVNLSGSLTSDKFLLFPPGTYLISPLRTSSPASACLFTELVSGSLKLVGQNATLSCTGVSVVGGATHASHMMWLRANGNDIFIDGLNFQGNNRSVYGLLLEEQTYPHIPSIKVSNCTFKNLYIPGSNPYYSNSYNESAGIYSYGPFKNIAIDKCTILNVSRAEMTNTAALTASSAGVVIVGRPIGSQGTIGPRTATISNSYFENITSGETSAYNFSRNADCDGLKLFGGNATGSDYIDCRASIYGNHFTNCRGRDIKIQADEVTIQANTSSLNILPIQGGGVRINCQTSSGTVSNNVFHFDPVTGPSWRSPFIEDGGTTAGSSVISFYDGTKDDRNRTITVTDNHVFNNVPQSVGILSNFFDCSEGDTLNRPSAFITVQGNKIVGKGGCLRFGNVAGRSTIQNPIYYTISDNMVSTITGGNGVGLSDGQNPAFLSSSNSSFQNTVMHIHGNVQSGRNTVPHLVNSSSSLVVDSANINAYSNWGIGLSASTQRNSSTSFIPRIGMMGDPFNSDGGIIAVQSVTLADEESYTFPYKGQLGYGTIRMICVGYDHTTNFMFIHGGNSLIDIYRGSNVVGNSVTNPDTDGKVNVWLSNYGYATSTVSVKNRLGDTRVFTLYTFG